MKKNEILCLRRKCSSAIGGWQAWTNKFIYNGKFEIDQNPSCIPEFNFLLFVFI